MHPPGTSLRGGALRLFPCRASFGGRFAGDSLLSDAPDFAVRVIVGAAFVVSRPACQFFAVTHNRFQRVAEAVGLLSICASGNVFGGSLKIGESLVPLPPRSGEQLHGIPNRAPAGIAVWRFHKARNLPHALNLSVFIDKYRGNVLQRVGGFAKQIPRLPNG